MDGFVVATEGGERVGSVDAEDPVWETVPAPGDRLRMHGYGKQGPTYEVIRREFLPWSLDSGLGPSGDIVVVVRELHGDTLLFVDEG